MFDQESRAQYEHMQLSILFIPLSIREKAQGPIDTVTIYL
jgi:hypothetical protein